MSSIKAVIACHMADFDGTYVPNSLDAVRHCVDENADRIEVDLQFLADNSMAVFHNKSLDGVTDASGVLERLNAEDIATARYQQLPCPPVAFFGDVVDAVEGSNTLLHVDLKSEIASSPSRVDALVAMLAPLGANCLVGSQNYENLLPLARRGVPVALDPFRHWHFWPGRPRHIEIQPIRRGFHGLWDDAPIAHQPGPSTAEYASQRIDDLQALLPGACEWMVDHHTIRYFSRLGVSMADLLHERGISLAAWTIQDRGPEGTLPLVRELLGLGVDTIIADRAGTIASYLNVLEATPA